MNSASLIRTNSFYPKICEVKYDSKSQFFSTHDEFEEESDEDRIYETSFYDLKEGPLNVEKLKWRCSTNLESKTQPEEAIQSIIEINKRGTYDVPSNSAVTRPTTTRYSVVKINDPFERPKTQHRSSMPSLQKSYTQANLKENKIPKETKTLVKSEIEPSPPLNIPSNISNKVEASISQRGFTMPPIQPPLPMLRREHTSYVHFVSNPFSFNEKPKFEKKLINYPALIRTRKVVPLEPVIKTEPKVIKQEVIEQQQEQRARTMIFDQNFKFKKHKNKKNNKKKNKKKKGKHDDNGSSSDSDPGDHIEPTGDQSNRPLAAHVINKRERDKIRFHNEIKEFSETESVSPMPEFKELEKEMEKIEEKVKQEQEELSNNTNYEYKSKLLDIKLKDKRKRVVPPIKPNVTPNFVGKKTTEQTDVEKIDEEKNEKEFHLRPLERPFRIPENNKLLGKEDEYILEDDWLLKWCILENMRNVACEAAFSKFDTNGRGFLRGETLIQALESIVKLSNLKLTYLFSVLNLVNIDSLIFGADLKLFTIIVSLANRISHLDENWFSNLLPQYDLFTIENKVFKVKNLWTYLSDQESKLIYINDVLIEFEAGGVTSKHIEYAKEKFSQKMFFDIIDYLTYIPLFVHIHDKIIKNPLIIKQDI